MTAVTISEVIQHLTLEAREPGYKEFSCAGDVADAIRRGTPPATPPPWLVLTGGIASMLAVNIIITPDSPPGSFRLVRHYDPESRAITCQVQGETVSHFQCQVIFEGILADQGSDPA